MIPVEKPGTPTEVLIHFGRKGMRWGVRNAYKDRVERTAARDRRVGQGKGTARENIATALTSSPSPPPSPPAPTYSR